MGNTKRLDRIIRIIQKQESDESSIFEPRTLDEWFHDHKYKDTKKIFDFWIECIILYFWDSNKNMQINLNKKF